MGVLLMIRNCRQILLLSLALAVALFAAGCTGADFLATGNSPLRIEIALEGTTAQTYDCIEIEVEDVFVRPLDGTCGADSTDAGEPCLGADDCAPGSGTGTCEGSSAGEVIGSNGIRIVGQADTVRGNLTGGDCDATLDSADAPEFVLPSPVTLSEGLYEISRLDVKDVVLYTENPVFLGACISSNPLDLATALGDSLRFTISAESEKIVRLVLHVDVWEQVLTGLESCFPPAEGGPGMLAVLDQAFSCDPATCDAAQP